MRGRLLVPVLIAAAATAWAQQGSTPDSSPSKTPQGASPQSSSEQNSAPKPAPSPAQTAPGAGHTLPNGMSDDLTFPESDPPAPSASSTAAHLAPPRSDRVRVDELGS